MYRSKNKKVLSEYICIILYYFANYVSIDTMFDVFKIPGTML